MMSSSNEIAEHGEAISRPGQDNQSHDTSHANAQASGSSHQWNGNANTFATINSHPPYPQDPGGVFVEERIQRTIWTGLGQRLMPPPVGSRGQDTRHLSRSPATSSLPRSPVEGGSTGPFLAPSSTESPKGGLATFQEAVLRFLIDIVSFTTFCLVIYLICRKESSNPGQTAHVRCGISNSWVDYDYSIFWRWRITLSDDKASCFILSTVAILTLLIPSTYNLVSRIGNRILWRFTRSVRVGEQNSEPNTHEGGHEEGHEATPLIKRRKREQRSWIWFSVSKILVSSRSANHTIRGLMTLVLGTSLQEQGYESPTPATTLQGFIAFVLSILANIVFFTLVFAALMSKRLAVGSVVLSQHPDCGVWWFSPDPSPKSDQSTSYGWSSFGQEVEAGEYARKCYHDSPGTDGCNSFLTQKIPYDKYENSPCPFEGSLCAEGRSSAYTLTTGIVPAKDLGINVPIGYSFRRNTTCSPLSRRAILSDDLKAFNYEYGASTASGNFTWTSDANPSWAFAGYNVATFYWTDNSTHDWEPSAEFKPWTHQAITLMFIQSQENYHSQPRSDPIFPAEQEKLYGPKQRPVYFNADPIVPALACVDTTEICSPNGSRCWTHLSTPDLELPQIDEKIGYYMLALSITESTTFNAIQLQGGRTLEATHMLQRFLSLPLEDEQWQVEEEHLFETSLARISITLRNYIRGAAAHIPNYEDWTSAGMGGMCHAYKLPGRGWVNIPVSGIILITCLAVLSYILSFEIGSYSVVRREVAAEYYQRDVDIQTMLVIDWILDAMLGPAGIPADERDSTGEYPSIPRRIIDGVDRATSPLSIPADQNSQQQAPSENAESQAESQGVGAEDEHIAPAETEA